MRTYETVVVIDSLLKNEEIDEIVNKIERVIRNNGGNIVSIDRWGKKRLAFEIKRRQYGYYVEIIFEAPMNVILILEREYGLEENILRYLSIHLDKRALEYRERQQMKIEKVKDDASENKAESKPKPSENLLDENNEEESSGSAEEKDTIVEPSSETDNVEKEIPA